MTSTKPGRDPGRAAGGGTRQLRCGTRGGRQRRTGLELLGCPEAARAGLKDF